MGKNLNFGDYHYFSYIARNPSYGFSTYGDSKTGMPVGYIKGYDKQGQPLYEYWQFNYDSQRIKRVHKDQKDKTGLSAVEFLRNSPACVGSINGDYVNDIQTGFFYKEINEAKDARDAVDSRRLVIEAESKALQLKGAELEDIAAYIGVFDPSPEVLQHRVLDFSSNAPKKFLELLGDPSIKVRALIRRAIIGGVIKKEGLIHMWDAKMLGANEDEAVSMLIKDEKLKKAVELHIEKIAK